MSSQLTNDQLIAVANEFGTPVYVYHAEKIKEQYQKLIEAFAGTKARFFYACKALTNISVLKYVHSLGCNIDCSSVNEAHLAIKAGFEPSQILYSSNGISFEEIKEAKDLGICINIDSISNLAKFGKEYGHSYPVGIRVRPNIMAGGNLKISTGHDRSKFGIPADQLKEVLAVIDKYEIHIQNLHIHTGSEIVDAEVFVQGIEVLFEMIPHFKELRFVDLGGGFKVPYKEGDPQTDIIMLAAKVKQAFESHPQARDLEIWFEPGKYLVSEAGYFVTQVNVLKETVATTFAGINSGFNHLIRPMFYDSYHRIENLSNTNGKEKEYSVVGNICETDTFAWNRAIREIQEKDFLVFFNAGAYCFEMSSNYNSRYKPVEVFIKEGKTHLIRKRDVFNDLLRNQVIIE